MKIRPVGAELSHADGRTDMTKLTIAFRNYVNALKKILRFPTKYTSQIQTARSLQTRLIVRFEVLQMKRLHSVFAGL